MEFWVRQTFGHRPALPKASTSLDKLNSNMQRNCAFRVPLQALNGFCHHSYNDRLRWLGLQPLSRTPHCHYQFHSWPRFLIYPTHTTWMKKERVQSWILIWTVKNATIWQRKKSDDLRKFWGMVWQVEIRLSKWHATVTHTTAAFILLSNFPQYTATWRCTRVPHRPTPFFPNTASTSLVFWYIRLNIALREKIWKNQMMSINGPNLWPRDYSS